MVAGDIHPSAMIADSAVVADNVTIGPYAVIEGHVEIGSGCRLGAHSVIQSYVRMGSDNRLHPHVVLGGLPQDLAFDPEVESGLEIGHRNVFREGFSANRSAAAHGVTRIGSDGYFMNNSHVGHDCRVGDAVVLAAGSGVGGHVELGDRVFVGGGAMIHQFCRIGSVAIVAGVVAVRKDVLPYSMVAGDPCRHYRVNRIGLRRAGIDGERLRQVDRAYRALRDGESLEPLPSTEELDRLRIWLGRGSKRGLSGFSRPARGHADR